MTASRVLASYFTIAGLYTLAASLIWGVNTLFLLNAGLDIFQVFIANAAFTAGSVVFELPTGIVADAWGRRVSFLLSVIILFASTLAYVAVAASGGGLLAFCAVSVLMGLGFTFYSGAVEAWVVDALIETGFEGQLDHVFARGSMVTGMAMLVGTVGGGLLGSVNLGLPYLVRAAMLGLVFVVAMITMHDLGFAPRTLRLAAIPAELRNVAAESVAFGWRQRSVRLLMVFSFFQWGFLSWGFYAWQPYFLELLGTNAIWVAGVIAASIALATVLGNALVDWMSQFCGKRSTILGWAVAAQAVAAVGVGLADSFWLAAGLFLIVAMAMGVMGPVQQAYLHNSIPTSHRASVISFNAMMGNAGGIIGQAGLGYLSRVRSIADGYVVGGLTTLLALPVLLLLRRTGSPADVIVGTKAALDGTCAPQGIPSISQVDATPVALDTDE